MKRLRQTAIISTITSILIVFVLANTVLAKPIFGPCVLLFEVPFTNKSFELPLWMWGLVPLSTLALFTLAALTSWVILFFWWRANVRRLARQRCR
jgi:hypothetical protein